MRGWWSKLAGERQTGKWEERTRAGWREERPEEMESTQTPQASTVCGHGIWGGIAPLSDEDTEAPRGSVSPPGSYD